MLMKLATDTARSRIGHDAALMRPRNYDTTIGRFTSFDTFEGRINEPLTLHKYVYTANDPVNNIDPTGHTTKREGQAAHKVIGAIYQFDHPESLVDFSIKPYSGGKKRLADIINYTGNSGSTGLLAEIKTPGEARLGNTQLQEYIDAYNSHPNPPFGKTYYRDSGWNPTVKFFWLGAADPNLANTFGVITANLNGVIVYQTFDRFSPPPIPVPVPLPEVEKIINDIYSYQDSFRSNPILAIPRELITQTILAGVALGTAGVLAAKAAPAIAAYIELGSTTTVVTGLI